MSRDASVHIPGPDILAEAARWFVLLASGEATATDRERWRAWLAADARHQAGWQRVEQSRALFSRIPREQATTSIEALERKTVDIRRGRRRALGSLGVLLAAGLMGWQGWRRSDGSADYRTAIGEHRELTLADGSRLQLDTDTAIDVDFSAHARIIHLRRGRLLLATSGASTGAEHQPPPLMVRTAEGRVQPLGTRFIVRQHSGRTEVVVLEARVALHPSAGTGEPLLLIAGQAATFDREGYLEQRAAGPGDDAWAAGMLIADNMPLIDFLAELARYRSTPLIADPSLRELRISGTYPLTNTDRALAALVDSLPVRVRAVRDDAPERGQIVMRTSP